MFLLIISKFGYFSIFSINILTFCFLAIFLVKFFFYKYFLYIYFLSFIFIFHKNYNYIIALLILNNYCIIINQIYNTIIAKSYKFKALILIILYFLYKLLFIL